MNYYPHHIGDFNNATRHLTRIERSVYRDLIDLYYDTEKPLTVDIKALCRRIVATSPEESTAVEQVLNEYFTQTEQGWIHVRCNDEIAKYHENINNKSEAGKASAAARAANKIAAVPVKSNGNSTAVEQVLPKCSTNQEPKPKPRTKNQEPEETKPPATPSALPEWLPIEAWNGFLAMRKAIKKPITPDAIPIALRKLESLRVAGHDARGVLEQSTMNCWQGLFEIKSVQARASPSRGPVAQADLDETNRQAKEMLFGKTKECIDV